MSDRIVVMRDGRFQQIGSPAEVYDRPRTAFVARFVGSANILRGTAQAGPGGTLLLAAQGGAVPVLPGERAVAENSPVTVAVRSEQIRFEKDGKNGIPAVVKEKSFTGGMLRIAFAPDSGEEVVASRHGIDLDLHPGERVALSWDPAAAVVVEEDAG